MISATRSIHFGDMGTQPAQDARVPADANAPRLAAREYSRPDIVLLGSLRDAEDVIRRELKVIGDEKAYHGALCILQMQARLIAELATELLRRYGEKGNV